MTMRGHGSLAIWSDVDLSQQTDYLHWLTREHVRERVGVDGFLAGRVFRCVEQDRLRVFIVYELVEPAALVGPSYLARLNAPTPWSQRIMPTLQNFVRGGGPVDARAGSGQGGVAAPLRFALADAPALATQVARQALVERLAGRDRIAAAWLLRVDAQATTVPTREKTLRRSAEGSFDALLVVEGLDDAAVAEAVDDVLAAELAGAAVPQATRFAACFGLDRRLAALPAAT